MHYDLVFLHTASVHIETFSRLAEAWLPGVRIQHLVNEQLLADAQDHDYLPAELVERIQAAVREAGKTASAVCCTCSTIGDAAEQTFSDCTGKYSIRIDRAMADQAVREAKRIKVLAALESTIGPTEQLLYSSAHRLGRRVELDTDVVEGAWDAFQSGNLERYHRVIAQYLAKLDGACELIVLAQASMAPAAQQQFSRMRSLSK